MIDTAAIKSRFDALEPFLGERDRRLWAASEAYAAGRGGILAVSAVTGVARSTIGRDLAELGHGKDQIPSRIRRPCSMAGLDPTGAVVLRRKVTRDALIAFAATLPPCTIATEACCGAHLSRP